MTKGKVKTQNEFIEELKAIDSSILVLGEYIKLVIPLHCKCLACGHEWYPTPKSLLKGHGCPRCAGIIRFTKEEFLKRLREVNHGHLQFDVISEYEGMSKIVTCKCKVCGTIWTPKANDLIHSHSGCPSCSGNIGFTHNRFVKELYDKNPHASKISLLSTYKGMLKPLRCKCIECGHIWSPIASSLIQGSGCPNCAKTLAAERGREVLKSLDKPEPKSHDWFLSRFYNSNIHARTIEIIGEYRGANKRIECRCKKCGHEWETIATGLLSGSGCPNCSHSSTSFMEQFIYFAFCKVFGDKGVINRDTTVINKEIDIFLPNESFAIEIGSWNWHKDLVENDLLKLELCKSKRIRMVIIYDSCRERFINNDSVWTYSQDLGSEKNHFTLKCIVGKCLQLLNHPFSFSEKDWGEITEKAYLASYRVDHEAFLQKLKTKNKHFRDIILLSDYSYARGKIHCKCRQCGREWDPTAADLLKGGGCPTCQIKSVGRNRSKQAQIVEWRKKNPSGTKLRCEKETGISRMTVYKWWESFN